MTTVRVSCRDPSPHPTFSFAVTDLVSWQLRPGSALSLSMTDQTPARAKHTGAGAPQPLLWPPQPLYGLENSGSGSEEHRRIQDQDAVRARRGPSADPLFSLNSSRRQTLPRSDNCSGRKFLCG